MKMSMTMEGVSIDTNMDMNMKVREPRPETWSSWLTEA